MRRKELEKLPVLLATTATPLLWKKIRRGLSAGRVQSVAMRLVADREKEIADFVPQEYWTLDALLKNDQGARFKAHYYGRTIECIQFACFELTI